MLGEVDLGWRALRVTQVGSALALHWTSQAQPLAREHAEDLNPLLNYGGKEAFVNGMDDILSKPLLTM